MTSEREQQFVEMVKEFPDSPMGHFSLGKFYLEASRYAEAAQALGEAVRLDPNYAAAWVALGDAWNGAGDAVKARHVWERALETPHGKKDASLQADLEERINQL